MSSSSASENRGVQQSDETAEATLVLLDHPQYGVWIRLAGVFLLGCAASLSLIYVELVTRLNLQTRVDIINNAIPFAVGVGLMGTVVVCSAAIGVDKIGMKAAPQLSRKRSSGAKTRRFLAFPTTRSPKSISYGPLVHLAILALSIIIAGVRIGKTMESQDAKRRNALANAQKAYEERLDAWRASDDGREYAMAKAQVRKLRSLGAKLLEDGRRLSHPKKRKDGAALLAAADAIDIAKLEKTMPREPDAAVVVPPLPAWKFANIVIWPALLEFVCTELLVLAIAFWTSHAFAPLHPAGQSSVGTNDETDDRDDEDVDGPGLRVVPTPKHPVFDCFNFDLVDAVFESEPDSHGADAWREAKEGLDLAAATWRGLRITASPQWTKRIGSTRRRCVWPVLVESSGRTIFIGTHDALRLVGPLHLGTED